MNIYHFNTLNITSLTKQIYRVRLKPQLNNFEFKAGQYIFLIMPDGMKVPLSIASPPEEKSFIELHIRLTPDSTLPKQMLTLFENRDIIHIEGAYGHCVLSNHNNRIIMIAGGTGFSPIKSMIESLLAKKMNCKLNLYLGAQTPAELYQTNLIESWDTNHCEFSYTPVINQPEKNWQGKTGFPHQVALNELESLGGCDFYISGSENMVMSVYQDLLNAGVKSENVFSDMLDIKREMGEL